ncbi:hypothetical protein A2U01_0059801 [Trifolium medium]|uniref:Uncharacterized protein n=1 Tax=Trifolium medium TaxID=97028 RepID=A0A392RPN4_9FABA|nr:hypothetical protein [Trifolium medium]
MLFVDEDGNEILYLGLHYPINYHQKKLDNPDCYILPGLFSEGEKPDYLPIEFIVVSDQHGGIEIVEQSALHYTWEQCVSQNFADGKGALVS